MNKVIKTNQAKSSVRFKRYSRKAYSVFASLNKVVTMGQLASYMTDAQMKKSGDTLCFTDGGKCVLSKSEVINSDDELENTENFNLKEKCAQLFFAFALSTAVCAPVLGQDLYYKIDEVTIERTHSKVASNQLHQVSVLTKTDIELLPHSNIQELLDQIPGLDVRSRGANGVQSDISMRGGTFDQVVILLNGINITDPQTGHFNLDLPLDLETIDRIEVLKGASMEIFGSGFSGAINIITTDKTPESTIKAEVSAGQYGYLKANVAAKHNVKKWTLSGNASFNSSSGYMSNTDYKNANMFVAAKCRDSVSGNWNIQLGGQIKEFGANSFYSLAYPNQFEATKVLFGSLQWNKMINDFGIEASVYNRTLLDRFELIRDYKDAPEWYKSHNHHLNNVSGANVKTAYYTSISKTEVGVELRNENIISNVIGEELSGFMQVPWQADSIKFTNGKNRLNVNYFAQQHFYVNKFTASVGVSGNYNTMFYHNYALGTNLGYAFTQHCSVFASANRALRLPTFTDLYYKSATQIANPDLNPEKSITTELGVNYSKNRFIGNASLYYRWGTDIIDWIKKEGDEKWKSMNHSKVDAFGGDISAAYIPGNSWTKKILATYSYCNLNKDSKEYLSKYALDYLKHKITIEFVHNIYKGFGASWSANFQKRNGEFINKQGELERYKNVFTLDGSVYWQFKTFKLFVESSNITNTKYYDYGGILQAPIWFTAGVVVKL